MGVIKNGAGLAYDATNRLVIEGQAAHDAVNTGSPVKTGARAITSNYATVATGDVADNICTTVGAQIIKPYSIPELDWQYASAAIIVATDQVVKAAGASGIRNYVTGIQVMNTHAAVSTEFVVKDGAVVIFRCFLPAAMQNMITVQFHTPLRGATVTAINAACITTGANVYANVQGYQAP